MFRRKSRKDELITLTFDMPEEAYKHWLFVRRGRPVNDVVQAAIEQTCTDPEPIRERCKQIAADSRSDGGFEAPGGVCRSP